ncbi:putative guanylate cyclase soluble subunit alpha-2-like [Apostichopus japonicus]|uniref:guanylate cyclase n=1 Tax=Stichopus japonicus TaxID=307972 RepID=A0A2G8LGA0_STIJA|nr:putative guanylate cyclase soluble subunit alpha-2-like [Apostichopus japonicus]
MCLKTKFIALTLRRVFASYGFEDAAHFLSNEGLEEKSVEFFLEDDDPPPYEIDQIEEEKLARITAKAADELGLEYRVFMDRFGEEFFCLCFEFYGGILGALGGTLVDFFCNIDGVNKPVSLDKMSPSFRCSKEGSKNMTYLHYYSNSISLAFSMVGQIRMASILLFNTFVEVKLLRQQNSEECCHSVYSVKPLLTSVQTPVSENAPFTQINVSSNVKDTKLPVQIFCAAYPFHVLFNRGLVIQQIGDTVMRMIQTQAASDGLNFNSYFKVLTPPMKRVTFENMLANINKTFMLSTTGIGNLAKNENVYPAIEVKGQMIYIPESECMMFLGSPRVNKLEELTGRGLYLADIPIHDATRDLILVGEETRAQDNLKNRMDQLKETIEEAHRQVEKEKQKTVDLLNLIFPADVAKKLWLGQHVPPASYESVTMLFSDIVGFTAICSTATPFVVIKMLNSLYTQFDTFCEILDIYKVETIGDAYCVAAGLYRDAVAVKCAEAIAKMAILMMSSAKTVVTQEGNPIKMRIGLHTGTVLAGIVGIKMPRYCLFGNNVTLANKFESHSEVKMVNVSPTTYELLMPSNRFQFTPRSRDTLPEGFPSEIPGTCYFLNGYTPNFNDNMDKQLFSGTDLKQPPP